MRPDLRAQFNDDVLARACAAFGVPLASARSLGGFESLVFGVAHGGHPRVLKISHTARRPVPQIEGEVAFLRALAEAGVPVAATFPCVDGRAFAELPVDGGSFTAVLYAKAEGACLDGMPTDPEQIAHLGRILGDVHRVGAALPKVDRTDNLASARENLVFLPEDPPAIRDIAAAMTAEIEALARDPASFGLVHGDFHTGNFHVDDTGRVTLFDFDDAHYGWYVQEIAVALFYALPHHVRTPGDITAGHHFLRHLLRGYRSARPMPDEALATIPLFMQQRELELVAVIHRSFDLNHLDRWCTSYMDGRIDRIVNGVPYFPLDLDAVRGG